MGTFDCDTFFKAKFAYLGLKHENDNVIMPDSKDENQGYMFPIVRNAKEFPQVVRDFYFALRNHVSSCAVFVAKETTPKMTAYEQLKLLASDTTSKEKISVDTYFKMFTLTKNDISPAHLDDALKVLVNVIKELLDEKRNHVLSLSNPTLKKIVDNGLIITDDHLRTVNGINNYVVEINKLDLQAQDYLAYMNRNYAQEMQAIDERQKEIAQSHNQIMESTHNKSIYHSMQQLFAMTYNANTKLKTTTQIIKLKEYSEKQEKINPPYIEKLEFKDLSNKTMKK